MNKRPIIVGAAFAGLVALVGITGADADDDESPPVVAGALADVAGFRPGEDRPPPPLPEPHYPVNGRGMTYGSAANAPTPESEPDLILAEGTDGTVGYIRKADLQGPVPASPEEAAAMSRTSGPRAIPLYDIDGVTVIGEYVSGRGTTNEDATG